MDFNSEYEDIKNIVKDDLIKIEKDILDLFTDNTPLHQELLSYLTAPAKRLRPLLGLLYLKSIFGEVNQKQLDVLLAVELIHNATLIHDDVIDEAQSRRKRETINFKFDNNLAVIAGDFLLSVAMEKIINVNSIEIIKICTQALKSTCSGEINQYFNKYKITSIDEYINKSKEKTALLFKIGILSGLYLANVKPNEKILQSAVDFSENFGIAFQIRDDLLNIQNSDFENINDANLGIYNAPVIFACEENSKILDSSDIINEIKKTKGIEKTKDLMDNYFSESICEIEPIGDNMYKKNIIRLVKVLKLC